MKNPKTPKKNLLTPKNTGGLGIFFWKTQGLCNSNIKIFETSFSLKKRIHFYSYLLVVGQGNLVRLDVLVGQVNQDLSGQRTPLILCPPGQQQDIRISSYFTVVWYNFKCCQQKVGANMHFTSLREQKKLYMVW